MHRIANGDVSGTLLAEIRAFRFDELAALLQSSSED